MSPAPELVCVGFTCADRQPSGALRAGGGAFYQALTAVVSGVSAGVVSAWGDALEDAAASLTAHGVPYERRRDAACLVFENSYDEGQRSQRASPAPPPLGPQDIPADWRHAPLISLAPVLDDVVPAAFASLGAQRLMLAPQGLLRARAADGQVRPRAFSQLPALPSGMRLVALSEEDLGGADEANAVAHLRAHAECVVLTRGADGALVFQASLEDPLHVPATPTSAVDPTGAGDVFAASLACALLRGVSLEAAASWASRAAAACVTYPLTEGVTRGVAGLTPPWAAGQDGRASDV